MKYKLGYDYYWNLFENLEYKGNKVAGANINVLFSSIFYCDKQTKLLPDKKYKGHYLFEFFSPVFNKKERRFDFEPSLLGLKLKESITLEIIDYELVIECQKDATLNKILPEKFKDIPCCKSIKISEKEFFDIFEKYKFTDLQTTGYFTQIIERKGD